MTVSKYRTLYAVAKKVAIGLNLRREETAAEIDISSWTKKHCCRKKL